MKALRKFSLLLLILCFPASVTAQEAIARVQEEVARGQETAARNHETAARLAEDAAQNTPDAAARAQEAALRAQEAATRAQQAANRAQEAANRDAGSPAAQAFAIRAQEAANRAQEAANRAQEAANRAMRVRVSNGTGAQPPPMEATPQTDTPQPQPQPQPQGPPTDAGTGPDSGANSGGAGGGSDDAEEEDFNKFINRRLDEVVKARIGPKNNTNQSETPSISANSTSLVDKSSVSDLIGLALNPSGTTGGSGEGEPTGASITVTAYAFKAFASGRDPLDPSFYNANRKWRKLSFTYGYDYTEGKEGNPQEKGSIYGVKFLPYDKRDPSDPDNLTDIQNVANLFRDAGPAEARIVDRVKRDLFNALSDKGELPPTIAVLTDERRKFIEFRRNLKSVEFLRDITQRLGGEDALIRLVDDIISQDIDPTVKFTRAAQDAFDKIRRKPQVAVIFLTKQRKQTRPDDYEGGLTMDLGVMDRWNLTFNGKFNYTDNKLTGDSTGGTFSTELQVPLNVMDQLGDRVPWMFSFGASGNWMSKKSPMYQGQAKLVIPFPRMPGFELPISISFASRSELLEGKEKKIKGRIGFTFDLSKFLNHFKDNLAPSLPAQ